MGWDGVSKVSFNFLYTLCVCRSCLYAPIYLIKTCQQHSYGFQNLMSSWGSWSKISNLQQVGDFLFFGYQSLLLRHIGSFFFLYTLCVCRSCLYAPIYVIKTCHQHSYGFQNLMSSWGSWYKISNLQRVGDFLFFGYKSLLLRHIGSFFFLHTLFVYRSCIHILIYFLKNFQKIFMGFKIYCQVVGHGQKFQNYSR